MDDQLGTIASLLFTKSILSYVKEKRVICITIPVLTRSYWTFHFWPCPLFWCTAHTVHGCKIISNMVSLLRGITYFLNDKNKNDDWIDYALIRELNNPTWNSKLCLRGSFKDLQPPFQFTTKSQKPLTLIKYVWACKDELIRFWIKEVKGHRVVILC